MYMVTQPLTQLNIRRIIRMSNNQYLRGALTAFGIIQFPHARFIDGSLRHHYALRAVHHQYSPRNARTIMSLFLHAWISFHCPYNRTARRDIARSIIQAKGWRWTFEMLAITPTQPDASLTLLSYFVLYQIYVFLIRVLYLVISIGLRL